MEECKWRWKKFFWKYYLKCDDRVFSIINTRGVFTNSYWDIFLPFISLFRDARVLVIGLGGGTTLFQVRSLFKNVYVETVEISDKSLEMASKFIDMKNEIVHLMDGWDFVLACSDKFNIVILDAYDKYGIPEKFLEEKFILGVKRILTNDGFFLINYAMTFQGRLKLENFLKLLKTQFKCYRVGPTITENNMVIIASMRYEREYVIQFMRNEKIFPRKLVRRIASIKEII